MKNFKLLLIATLIVLVVSGLQNAIGQSTQTVSVGSTFNYVTNKNISGSTITYTFSGPGVVAGDYTLGVATNVAGSFTQPITWNASAAGKTVTITAQEATATCTAANTTTIAVTIDAAVTVVFAAASTAAECENTNDFTTNVTFSRTMAVSEFPMTLSVDVVVDGATVATHTATVTNPTPLVANTAGVLTIPNATFLFNGNTTTSAQTQTITINATGSVDNHGGNIGRGVTYTHSKVINPVPVTNAIVPN